MTTIKFQGREWRLFKSGPKKLVFHPVSAPAAKQFLKWRTGRGLTQRAAAATLGISQGQLARIEAGTRTAPSELINKI